MRISTQDKLNIITGIIRQAYEDRFPSGQYSGAGIIDFTDEAAKKLLKRFGTSRGLNRPSKEEMEQREREWDLKEKRERISQRVFELVKTTTKPWYDGDIEQDVKGLVLLALTIDDMVNNLIK